MLEISDLKDHLTKISRKIDKCKCNICDKEFLKQNALSSHLRHKHNITAKEYYDNFFLRENENICICGSERKFDSIKSGYRRYCGINCKKRGFGEDNPNFGNFHKSPSHSEFMRGNNFRQGISPHNKGKKMIFSDEHLKNIRKHLNKVNSIGLENKGGRTTFYKYKDLIVQGKYELYFVILNYDKIQNKPKPIKTPFGFYSPDFDMGGYFVEIKSSYTFKNCVKGIQIKKIKWVSNNVKKVVIEILELDDIRKFLSSIDYKQYIHKKHEKKISMDYGRDGERQEYPAKIIM